MLLGSTQSTDNTERKTSLSSPLDFFADLPDMSEFGQPPCSESDPEAFFPQEIEVDGKLIGSKYHNLEAVKSICRECPYQQKCLDYALMRSDIGIWGGLTENERKNYRRKLRITIRK